MAPCEPLTGMPAETPRELIPLAERRFAVALAAGDLWRLDAEAGQWVNLTAAFAPEVTNIQWPASDAAAQSGDGSATVLIATSESDTSRIFRVNAITGETMLVARPSPSAPPPSG